MSGIRLTRYTWALSVVLIRKILIVWTTEGISLDSMHRQLPTQWELANCAMTFFSILLLACFHSKGVVAGIEAKKRDIHIWIIHFLSFYPWMSVDGERGHKGWKCQNSLCKNDGGVRKDLLSEPFLWQLLVPHVQSGERADKEMPFEQKWEIQEGRS